MKKKGKKIGDALLSAGVGVVGGVAANLVDANVLNSQSTTIQAAVKAAAGAILPVIIKNDIVEAFGASMIGVAGYQLAGVIGVGEDVNLGSAAATETAATSGIGFTPSYRAAMAGDDWVASRAQAKSQVNGTADASIATTSM